jgi:hypothetical protein
MSEFQGDTFLTAYVWTHSSLNDARRKSHTLTLKAHAPPSKCARAPYVTHVPTYMHPCHIHRLPNPASRLRAAALCRLCSSHARTLHRMRPPPSYLSLGVLQAPACRDRCMQTLWDPQIYRTLDARSSLVPRSSTARAR